jgi:DNA-directed RNA polymerase alpha subunit
MVREKALTCSEAARLVSWAASAESSHFLTAAQTRALLLGYQGSGTVQRILAEVRDVLGVSRERVRQIEAKAYDRFKTWQRRRTLAEVLEMKAKDLAVMPPVRRALAAAGIGGVRELTSMSREDLVKRLGYPVGRRAAREVQRALHELGVDLAPSPYSQDVVESLALSTPALVVLSTAGVHFVAELAEMSFADIDLAFQRFRRHILQELEEALGERGFSLSREPDHGDSDERTPIELLELPQRAYGVLKRAGYSTVEQLEAVSGPDLMGRVPQFGVKCLEAVKRSIWRFRQESKR